MEIEYAANLDFHYDELWDNVVVGEPDFDLDRRIDHYKRREDFTKKYAWAIPTEEALATVAKFSPLVEIGAGTGYWAYELRKRGVVIDAYDEYPANGQEWTEEEYKRYSENGVHARKNWYHRGATSWTEVSQGTPSVLKAYDPTWNLFLCWPPYQTDMAMYALGYHRGKYIVYIGEDSYGCNGDKWYWRLLNRYYEAVEHCSVPQWPGIHDYLTVFERKGR